MSNFWDHIRYSRPRRLFAILVILAIAGLSAIIIRLNIERINRQLEERLHNALKFAAITLPPAMWQLNHDYLNDFVKAMFLEEAIVHIGILSDDKTLISHSHSRFEQKSFSFFEQSQYFITGTSDIFYNTEKIGSVRIAVSREGIYRQLILNTVAAVFLICSIIGAMVFYYNRLIRAEKNRQAAEASSRAKSRFLANMSHELRTPLNAILGFTQLMLRNRNADSQDSEYLNTILRSGEHLLTLINQVLDLSKIEANHMTLNPQSFDLYQMLNDLEGMFRLRAGEKHLHLIFERDPRVPRYIKTDEMRFRQILINLLSNAIKFTEEGGVSLRISYSAEDILNVEIEDTGPGMDDSEINSIFTAFMQSDSGKRSSEGTGLGLVISRQFVRMMGGEMTVSSEKEKGTVFSFHIRVSRGNPVESEIRRSPRRVIALESGQPRYRILIVDDRWDNRRLLCKLLEPLGFDIKEAEDGQQAVEIWERYEPHLIWMDMRMPVMDGYEATRRIKAAAKERATAIIALTASAFEEERKIVLSAGCDDFVRKPFRESEIFEMMETHIGAKFVYEEDDKKSQDIGNKKTELSSEALADLPKELSESLEDATLRADMNRIYEIISTIETFDKNTAAALRSLADEFEYAEILRIIRERGKL